ncbi:penicillin amidase [Streptomyces badius]
MTGKFDPEATPADDIGSATLGAGEGLTTQLAALSDTLDEIPALLGPNGNGIGSNSWVVGGAHTTSGKALLANDPHLAPMLPSLWYQMGLHCRKLSATCQYDTAGYTFSGMPGVIIGHNQDIAWGLTNLGADVTDLFLESSTDGGYLYDGGRPSRSRPARRPSRSRAAGTGRSPSARPTTALWSPTAARNWTRSARRPPSSNAAPDRADGYAVALKWTALQPGKSMDAVFAINRAKDFTTFRAAAENFEVPSQNLIYADTEGNIGYQAPGKIPVRSAGFDGTVPAPGWDPKYAWKGYIPFDELPYEYNPDRGYIVTANQAVIDEKKYPQPPDQGLGLRRPQPADQRPPRPEDQGRREGLDR